MQAHEFGVIGTLTPWVIVVRTRSHYPPPFWAKLTTNGLSLVSLSLFCRISEAPKKSVANPREKPFLIVFPSYVGGCYAARSRIRSRSTTTSRILRLSGRLRSQRRGKREDPLLPRLLGLGCSPSPDCNLHCGHYVAAAQVHPGPRLPQGQ